MIFSLIYENGLIQLDDFSLIYKNSLIQLEDFFTHLQKIVSSNWMIFSLIGSVLQGNWNYPLGTLDHSNHHVCFQFHGCCWIFIILMDVIWRVEPLCNNKESLGFLLPILYVEYLSSLWMSFEG
jgi:hypothetical protein